jgi:hypothetical protein
MIAYGNRREGVSMRAMVLVCVLVAVVQQGLAQERKQPVNKVRAQDLSSGASQIEGRLGKPYGTIMKLQAVWEGEHFGNPKRYRFVLRITELDGQPLSIDRQIVIPATAVKWLRPPQGATEDEEVVRDMPPGGEPVGGQKVEGRVYESGGFVGRPPAVDKILHIPASQSWYVFGFHSFVYFIDYLPLRHPLK